MCVALPVRGANSDLHLVTCYLYVRVPKYLP